MANAGAGMVWRLFIVLGMVAASHAIHHPIFIFGDSNSDTGNRMAIDSDTAPDLPYGRTFFKKRTGRASDGRLIVDFLTESVNNSFISPYLNPFGGNFRNGANFAYGGANIALGDNCYPLDTQLNMLAGYQYIVMWDPLFKDYHMNESGGAELRRGLYMVDIGQNDLVYAFEKANFSYEDARKEIPYIIKPLFNAINQSLNNSDGGRKIWVHGTGPLGCLPFYSVSLGKNNSQLDAYGCHVGANDLAKDFNNKLKVMCQQLNTLFGGMTTVVFTDIYSIKYDLVANHTKYGFEDPMKWCLQTNPPCPPDSRYISWDSIHYTDAANALVASKILSGDFSEPPIKFETLYNRWEV